MAGGILEWGAETVQAVFFVAEPHRLSATNLFKSAFGTEPTTTQESIHPQYGRLGSASLSQGDTVMVVSLQPGRVDVAVNSAHDANANIFRPDGRITDVVNTLESVQRAAINISEEIGQSTRLAFHCRLVMSATNRAESNTALLRVMPYKLILGAEEDFILQLNYQTNLTGHKINRIVKWSSESLVMVFEPSVMGFQQETIQKDAIVSVVHLDFNTVPSNTRYQPAQSKEILQTLAGELIKARKNELRFKS